MTKVEPFIRWAGGKTWLLPHLSNIIQKIHINHYHEPFLGGGAVFFALEHANKSYLSDANEQLINAYIQIRDNPQEVINFMAKFDNSEDEYYRVRSDFNCDNTIENAARLLYLNQTSYNGLFRVNKEGQYNVPYGFRREWNYDKERIYQASKKLQRTRISVGDFEVNKYRIKKDDLIFLDPPYTVSHNNNGFIEYNKNLFSLDDQQRLKSYIEYIKRKQAYYILTNAAHAVIKDIFNNREDRMLEVQRQSLIGGKNARRTQVTEYIFTNITEV